MQTIQASELVAGDTFTYATKQWIALAQGTAGVLSLSVDILAEKPFNEDEEQSWLAASIRTYMNEDLLAELVSAGASEGELVSTTVDLTAVNGDTDYGTDSCRLFPLTEAQYGIYKDIIPAAASCYWLVTPYSANESYIGAAYTHFVRIIRPDGSVDGCSAEGGLYGVRPACTIAPSTNVEVDDNWVPEEDRA